jgi:osmoprotectant transport system substrate-binding protein
MAGNSVLVTAEPDGELGAAPGEESCESQPLAPQLRRPLPLRLPPFALTAILALTLAACGSGASTPPRRATTTNSAATTAILPGTGRPPVTIGDKNFTEQFILGELYDQALVAQGFTVNLNKNIGSTEVTVQALQDGQLDMYPEYIGTFDTYVAHDPAVFGSTRDAFAAAQRYAGANGLRLLRPTPFSDTDAIAVPATYGAQHHLRVIPDLVRVESGLTLGAPPQFVNSATGLLGMESAYGVNPAHVQPLAIGLQYQALQDGSVQAADVFTTDGQLASGQFQLLGDPDHLFGFENVAPVVTQGTLLAEGPAFVRIIDSVSTQLTTEAMRQLNADVNIYNESPATVARQFLVEHNLLGG